MSGVLGNLPPPDDEDELFQRGYVVGLGLVIPRLGEPQHIIRRNLEPDDFVHDESSTVH